MPLRDPNKVQLDFPELNADLIAELSLVGTIGLLDFATEVRPVFIIGARNLTVEVENPEFQSAEVFSGDAQSPAANTVIADTTALPAGVYNITAILDGAFSLATFGVFALQHRNAANNATLATLLQLSRSGTNFANQVTLPLMRYRIGINERLRAITPGVATSNHVSATIFAALVPVP